MVICHRLICFVDNKGDKKIMDIFISSETYSPIGSRLYETRQTERTQIYKTINPILEKFKERNYGKEFTSICIIAIIHPVEHHEHYKERILLKPKKQEADIRLYIDYEKFKNTNVNGWISLFWQNIIKSIQVINNRKKGDFDGDRLISDLLDEIGMTLEDLMAV